MYILVITRVYSFLRIYINTPNSGSILKMTFPCCYFPFPSKNLGYVHINYRNQGKLLEFYNNIKFPNYDNIDDFGILIDKAKKSIFAKFQGQNGQNAQPPPPHKTS